MAVNASYDEIKRKPLKGSHEVFTEISDILKNRQ